MAEKNMNMNEEWKYIPDCDNRYMVSNLGRVKSLKVRRSIHGKIVDIEREKIIKPTDNGHGYLTFSVAFEIGKSRRLYVHRAVAEAFLPRISGKDDINHKDYNKKNNSVENLEWCTPQENTEYSRPRMHGPYTFRITSTGEKYITQRKGRYRVSNKRAHIDKTFATIEEAKDFRDKNMNVPV